MEYNKKENTTVQKFWDAAKEVMRVKYIEIQAYVKKQEKSQIHNLTLHLKELKKEHRNKAWSQEKKGNNKD